MNEYEKQAEDFCKKYGVHIHITKIGTRQGFPYETNDYMWHDVYDVRVSRKADKSKRLHTPFYASAMRTSKGERITKYDVLSDLSSYAYMDCSNIEDFAIAYGYDTDEEYKKTEQVYKACLRLHEKVNEVFADCLDELADIV